MFNDPPPTWRSFWIFLGGIVAVPLFFFAAGLLYINLSGPYESIRGWSTSPLQPRHIDQLRAGKPFYLYHGDTHVFIVAKRDVNTDALQALSDNLGFRLGAAAIQQIVTEHGKRNRALFIAAVEPDGPTVTEFPADFDAQSGAIFAVPMITPARRSDGGINLTIAPQTERPPRDSR